MPTVSTVSLSSQPIDRVWREVLDIASFPSYMEEVREVEILREEGNARRSRWSILLKGSILEWEEEERIDHEKREITFHQIEGDLAYFTGSWRVWQSEQDVSIEMHVEFDIGIPLLADMLNPVAARALEENAQKILSRIDTRAGSLA
jgi:ribosome-associated toxin RatA of RatAB toxin-antitoxin module